MTIRQMILAKVGADLPNMKTTYGYNLNYNNFHKGFKQLASVKNYPYVCYDFGAEGRNPIAEDDTTVSFCELPLYISAYFEADKARGSLVDIREKIINDFTKFIEQDVSITNNKTLHLEDIDFTQTTEETRAIETVLARVNAALDEEQGNGAIVLEVDIKYYHHVNNEFN